VGTAGHATGIVVFNNGDAEAVSLTLQPVPRVSNDVQLVATTRFLYAGSYTADEWGPRLGGSAGVSERKMNDHDGISLQDLLKSARATRTPGTTI
jgi:hypothetical protein